jgi:prepilin-type N-terminal cleavage/methylation domain-containing protein
MEMGARKGGRMKKRNKGFTLIELLVVMAIIAILTAIVVPNVVKYIAKGRVTKAQAEAKNIELALTRMVADADRSSLSHLFNPNGVEGYLSQFGDPVTGDVTTRMQAAITLYTRTIYALLREGRAALSDSDTVMGIGYGAVLDAGVVKRLGTSYLADIREDPWGKNLYQIYPGPWPSRKRAPDGTVLQNEPIFRIYQVESTTSNLPGSKGGAKADNLTLTNVPDPENPGLENTIGFAAPRDVIAFVWSMGENMISGQAVYSNAVYVKNEMGNYLEQEENYMGGGDDINNWDSGRSWERLYN